MARIKIQIPDKELPKKDPNTGWIIKYEYRFKPIFEIDNINSKKIFYVELSSTREFVHFNYDLDYKVTSLNSKIKIEILGLNTNNLNFPLTGRVVAKIPFDRLFGVYEFEIVRQSGESNIFVIDVDPLQNSIKLIKELPDKKTNRKFVEYIG